MHRKLFPPRITGDPVLVQGGLDIACKVSVKMSGTIKNHLLMDRYFELVRSLYAEAKNEVILGSFLRPKDVPCTPKSNARKKKVKTPVSAKKAKPNRDIRTMFQHMKRKDNETNIGSSIVSQGRPLTLIIIINIFEYLVLSTTLYPLTSIIPCKKRLSSLQYSIFHKSCTNLGLNFAQIRGFGQKTRNPRNLIPIKYCPISLAEIKIWQ